jgi:oligopeptide transport system permease protein
MSFAILIGIPAGILSALRKNSYIDYGTMVIAMAGISIPSFVVAPLLAGHVATRIPLLKVAGWGDPLDWVLPALTLGLATAAYLARITRGGMLEVLNQDYIRTAHAKGVKPAMVVTKHALRGGIIPAVAYIGPAFAMLITGSFIIETIFQVPGMGQHFVNATKDRDYFLLQGVVILFGAFIVFANLAADIILVMLNPRIRP